MKLRAATIGLLLTVAAATGARALELPAAPAGRVNDYAGALSPDARQRLEHQLAGYAQGTTQQIAVAIFKSLDGESLEDTSMRLAERWKIGSKQGDDGVLVTVFLDDHKVRIDVGYGLEGKLTDAQSGRIIRDVIAPAFRRGDVEGGLRDACAAIESAITGRVPDGGLRGLTDGTPGNEPPVPLVVYLFIALFILFLIYMVSKRGRGGGVFTGGGWSGGSSGWSSSSGGGWSSGGGGFSGGGGSFGGGGASGSW